MRTPEATVFASSNVERPNELALAAIEEHVG